MERARTGIRSPNDPASTGTESTVVRHRAGAGRHAVFGLIAVVLAYLGLALGLPGTTASGPAGLISAEAGAQRAHLLQRDRGQTVVTVRGIDPPRADRPSDAGAVARFAIDAPRRDAVLGRARVAEAGRAAAPLAFRPRGPPVDVAEINAA